MKKCVLPTRTLGPVFLLLVYFVPCSVYLLHLLDYFNSNRVKREALLQYAQCAIAALKGNADLARLAMNLSNDNGKRNINLLFMLIYNVFKSVFWVDCLGYYLAIWF